MPIDQSASVGEFNLGGGFSLAQRQNDW